MAAMTQQQADDLEKQLDDLAKKIEAGEASGRIDDPNDHIIGGRKIIPLPLMEATAAFNLDKHLVELMRDIPFFAQISRWIRKIPTYSIPTAGVTYNLKTDELTMYYNPTFFKPSLINAKYENGSPIPDLTNLQVRCVLTHEFYHLIFNHVTDRRRNPHGLWNIGTDLAINSIIIHDNKGDLPEGCLLPGKYPAPAGGRKQTKEEKEAQPIAALIEKFPTGQASEWYFERLLAECERQGIDPKAFDPGGAGGIGSMDDHDLWDDIPEETKERINGKIKSIIEKAAKHADNQSNGWGNIPAGMREDIRRSVSNIVDWKALLRQFIGMLYRGNRANSMKRINRRFPYVHPGVKRGYVAKLLVAIDQSGSVGDDSLAVVAGELNSLTKNVTIDVCTFDTSIDERDMYTWHKGRQMDKIKRTRCGGTDFNAPTHFVNDPKNRGRWDGLLIVTDGECGPPDPSFIRRAYLIVPGRKLLFETSDTVITMDEGKKYGGSWR